MARFSTKNDQTFSGRKPYILFVSTGNTCRAPMSYGVTKRILEEAGIGDLDVRTAGVMTVPGLLPTQECRQLLAKDGIDISRHRSCQLTPDLIKKAYLILGMTSFHLQMVLRMKQDTRHKTFLLKGYTGSDPKNDQVQDPMGCTLEVYKKVFREIRAACRRLIRMEIAARKQERKKKARSVVQSAPRAATVSKKARSKAPARKPTGRGAAKARKPTRMSVRPKSKGLVGRGKVAPKKTTKARGRSAKTTARKAASARAGKNPKRTAKPSPRVKTKKRTSKRK